MSTILAVDCGNSTIKWGFYSTCKWIRKETLKYENAHVLNDQWQSITNIDLVIVSSVVSQKLVKQLKKIFISLKFDPFWINSCTFQCGLTNSYEYPSNLGSDRWAALIAAWDSFHAPCLVINVGTATTVDVISKLGVFLGGYILPGPFISKKCLVEATQITVTDDTLFQNFPKSTSGAINGGISLSLIAFVQKIKSIFLDTQGYPIEHCIFSGGAFHIIKPYIDFPYIEIDNIVLDGLLIIATDMLQGNK